jgi:hypothetical protein
VPGLPVRLEGNTTVFFKCALRLSGTEDYAPILEMLKWTLAEIGKPTGVYLRELDFLNSSGITMLSRFVIEVRNQSHVISTLSRRLCAVACEVTQNLQRLMPGWLFTLSEAIPHRRLSYSLHSRRIFRSPKRMTRQVYRTLDSSMLSRLEALQHPASCIEKSG